MIKLSTPKAYATIGPLYGSTGHPLRCADPCLTRQRAGSRNCARCHAVCTFPAADPPHPISEAHSWYYDLTPGHSLSEDPESLLVWLCPDCATRLEAERPVSFASTDTLCDIRCWDCGVPVRDTERKRR